MISTEVHEIFLTFLDKATRTSTDRASSLFYIFGYLACFHLYLPRMQKNSGLDPAICERKGKTCLMQFCLWQPQQKGCSQPGASVQFLTKQQWAYGAKECPADGFAWFLLNLLWKQKKKHVLRLVVGKRQQGYNGLHFAQTENGGVVLALPLVPRPLRVQNTSLGSKDGRIPETIGLFYIETYSWAMKEGRTLKPPQVSTVAIELET